MENVIYVTEKDAAAINHAAEELKFQGGVIILEEGTYTIDRPVTLYSHTTLKGKGRKTVLKKTPGFRVRVLEDADYNQRRLILESTEMLREGAGIQIFQTQEDPWGVTVATVTEVGDGMIRTSDYMKRDYPAGCIVSGSHSVIAASDVTDVVIQDLAIDGFKEKNDFINGCVGGGIYFYKSRNCAVKNVLVTDFNGDGISWQTTCNVRIQECEVKNCSNFGLHPGAGSQYSRVENCTLHHNGEVGLFLCWRVKYGRFLNNVIFGNGGAGISIGHRDTDNEIAGNHIEGHVCGIYFRPEKPENASHRNNIHHNKMVENQTAIVVKNDAKDINIEENDVYDRS